MRTRFLGCTFFVLVLSVSAVAQRSGGGKPSLGPPGSTGSTSLPPIAPPSGGTAVFVTGKVVLDDGTELTEPAVIQTICQGRRHSETYSDSHGSFSFQFGDPRQGAAASISDASSSNMAVRSSAQLMPDLRDCQLQAELAGFSSQAVELNNRGLMNSVDVGRVPLHRLAHVDGTSISVTSALAPPPAKKAFEKGLEQEKKNKLEDAQKSFEKAVQIYPRYATAWYQLGCLQLHTALISQPQSDAQNQAAQAAKHSFEQSVAADAKYVNPYDGLAQLAMVARNWHDVIDITAKLVSLNPVNFPNAYYDSAVANYNLKNFDDAEKSALQGVRMDEGHRIPRLQYLLALILLQKQNYQAAAEHMQLFLSLAKQPEDLDLARKGLAEIENSSASAQSPAVNLNK